MFFVAVCLVVYILAQTYFEATRARASASGFPIVGSVIADAITGLIVRIQQAAGIVDTAFNVLALDSIRAIGRLVVLAFQFAGAALIVTVAWLGKEAAQATANIHYLFTVEIPRAVHRIVALEHGLVHLANVVVGQLAARVAALDAYVVHVVVVRLVAAEQQLLALVPFLPLLQRLAAFEQATAIAIGAESAQLGRIGGAVGVLEGDITQVWQHVGQLERAITEQQAVIAKLVALLTLAGLGAVALENVVRLAKDPCYCLTTGGFSDLPGRVEALENFGP